jgi:hypothetical protein
MRKMKVKFVANPQQVGERKHREVIFALEIIGHIFLRRLIYTVLR